MSDKYTVTLTEEQLRIVNDALDLYSRLGMGQLEIVEEFLRTRFYKRYYDINDGPAGSPVTRGQIVRDQVDTVKALVFDHPPNGSWGIADERVPADCREAYDIYQVTRKAVAETRLAREDDPERRSFMRLSVHLHDYMPTNPGMPPVEVKSPAVDPFRGTKWETEDSRTYTRTYPDGRVGKVEFVRNVSRGGSWQPGQDEWKWSFGDFGGSYLAYDTPSIEDGPGPGMTKSDEHWLQTRWEK